MNTAINRGFVFSFAALFFIGAGCYAYWHDPYFLIAPLALLIGVYLVQNPVQLFYLLILSIPWSFEYSFDQTLGTDLPDEPLMLLASLSIFFYISYQRQQAQAKLFHPLTIIVFLQLLWTILTVATSTELILSFKYLLAKGWYLLAFLFMPLLLLRNEQRLKNTAMLLCGSMMVVTIIILVRQASGDWKFATVSQAVKPFFRNHVNYSSLLVFIVPLLIGGISLAITKRIKAFYYVLLSIAIVAIYFSYARGAWLALLGGLVAYWLLKKRLLFVSWVLFLCIVIGSVIWLGSNDRVVKLSSDYKTTIFHTNFRQHLVATYQLKDLSNAERIYRWIAGVRMAKDNWMTGTGPSTFYPEYKGYTLPLFKTYVSNNLEHSTVHNYFLLTLIEQGLIGGLLLVVLIASLFWYAQRIYFRTQERFWRVVVATVSSILVMQCTINFLSDMIETDKVGSVFYVCIATLIVADFRTREYKSDLTTDIQSIS
ncbi:MAG: O-antigen ligase family protein [Flavisolibacter sp.]